MLPKYLTTVTPLSKTVALSMFIIFPLVAFILGTKYGQLITENKLAERELLNISMQKKPDQKINLPPNGTILFSPSHTPTPTPKKISSGTFISDLFQINIQVPNSIVGEESLDSQGIAQLIFHNSANKNLAMRISKSKQIYGYGGENQSDCQTIVSDGKNIKDFSNNPIKRCSFQDSKTTRIWTNLEVSQTTILFIDYHFEELPSTKEFVLFDALLASITANQQK